MIANVQMCVESREFGIPNLTIAKDDQKMHKMMHKKLHLNSMI